MTFSIISLSGAALCLMFFIAGIIDAVCGGGGLLTLPAFMAIGFPTALITGTNQCSIFCGNVTSFARFAKNGVLHWRSALCTVPFTVAGSMLGARVNMLLPEKTLQLVMTILLPVAAAVVLSQRGLGKSNRVDTLSAGSVAVRGAVIGLTIGFYQGFYGAGSGTFFMLAFAALMRLDLVTASGNTKLVSLCSVTTASVTYALSGNVYWPAVAAATVFNVAGNYIGAGLAMKRGARFIRPMFMTVLALLVIRVVWNLIAK